MKKKLTNTWTLAIVELAESPFTGESKRKKTRFEGTVSRNGETFGYHWGVTREEVEGKARDHKARYEANQRAQENVEVIEL